MSERSDYLTLQQFINQLHQLPADLETHNPIITYCNVKFSNDKPVFHKSAFNKPWNCLVLDFSNGDEVDDDITVRELEDNLYPALARNPKAAVVMNGQIVTGVKKPMLEIITDSVIYLHQTKLNTTPVPLTISEFVAFLNNLQIRTVETAIALRKEKMDLNNIGTMYLIEDKWYLPSELEELFPRIDFIYCNTFVFKVEHSDNVFAIYRCPWTLEELTEKLKPVFAPVELPPLPSLSGLPNLASSLLSGLTTVSEKEFEKLGLRAVPIRDGFIISQDQNNRIHPIGVADENAKGGIRPITNKEIEIAKRLGMDIIAA